MKNKFSLIVVCLYTLILILLSFSYEFIDNVNLSIISKLSLSNPLLAYKILKYTETVILYIGYGICMMICCCEYFSKFKDMLLFSISLSILMVILDLAIKSFYINIDFIYSTIALICVIIGKGIEILVKMKQARGEKDEK